MQNIVWIEFLLLINRCIISSSFESNVSLSIKSIINIQRKKIYTIIVTDLTTVCIKMIGRFILQNFRRLHLFYTHFCIQGE